MRNVIILVLVVVGALGALLSALVSAAPNKPLAPYFNPAPNPYAEGIYARGIVESYQSNGANINLYPEVAGSIARLLVAEGQTVMKGAPLVQIEDSIQRATVEQLRSQAEAAQALLEELHAEPRRENLQVAAAQSAVAQAGLKTARDALDKQQASYALSPESVSDQRAEGGRCEPRDGDAAVRADAGRRVGVRREKPGEAGRGAGEGVRRVERSARQVHRQSAHRRDGHVHRRRGRQLRLAPGRL